MKTNYSSVARFLATLSIVTFLVLPAANGGSRWKCQNGKRIYYSSPKPKLNSSGPAAPAVKSSESEIATHTAITILSIRRQIAESLAKKTNQKVLVNIPSNFNLTTSIPTRFNLLNIGREPSVKAFQEDTPFQLVQTDRKPAVRAFQEDVPPESFILADEGPPPEPDDPKYIPPPLEVGGADVPIPLGELIHLWVKPPENVSDNLQSIAYTWTVLPNKKFVAWPDNTRILFGSGIEKTTYIVIITASYVFIDIDSDGKLTSIVQRAITKMITVKVGDGTVVPPTGGDDGLSGLSKQAYDWIIHVNLSNTYTTDMRRADAAKLAISFSGIATQIQNGTLTDVTAILKATKASNDRAIITRDIWLPWFTRMSEYLQKSYSDGTIKTLEQFTTSWLAIAKGLETAAK